MQPLFERSGEEKWDLWRATMPSGYENSPDYGGPDPSWRGGVIVTLLLAAFVAWLAFG